MAPDRRPSHLLAAALILAAVAPSFALAQEPLPAVLPEVIFLIEDSNEMLELWQGDPSVTVPLTRWAYTRDAVVNVVNNAPLGMNFGVVMSANGTGNEPDGFERIAYPGMSPAAVIAALTAYTPTGGASRQLAESYADLIDAYLEQPAGSPRSWNTGPFEFDCSSVTVIVIGTEVGFDDQDPDPSFVSSSPPNDVGCNSAGGFQECWLDNVSHWAFNTFSYGPASAGAIQTSTILLDSSMASADAAALFQETANSGDGTNSAIVTPGGIGTAMWVSLSWAYEGSYSNSAVSMTPAGDMLFATYFEVEGGHPLYKGHVLAWMIDVSPVSPSYGEIIPCAVGDPDCTPQGAFFDAGQELASRDENPGNPNQGSVNQPEIQRNGWTAWASQEFYGDLQPFDSTSLGAGTDLTTLMVEEISDSSNPLCAPLEFDYDYDCDSDYDDAQILMDFLRGDEEATFHSTGIPRGEWMMGDTGHSVPVAAPANIPAVATESHFIAFRQKIATLPGMAYIASNAGMIHAINLDVAGLDGSEFWFYIPRAKLDKSAANAGEFADNQAREQFLSGQTFVNDGRLSLDYVWLDGYITNLSGCSGPGYVPGERDGTIHEDGCEWHRVLTWSGGYGARHTYALDVTDPLNPRFLWERVDTTDPAGQGRALAMPAVGAFWDRGTSTPQRRWLVAWGSGGQNPDTSDPANLSEAKIYIHDMVPSTAVAPVPTSYPTGGFVVPAPTAVSADSDSEDEYPASSQGLFGTVTMIDVDADGSVDAGYVGDGDGYVYKILFNPSAPASPTTCLFSEPSANDDSRALFYQPAAFWSQTGALNIFYGSGSPYDIYEPVTGGLYARRDPEPFGCQPSVAAGCTTASSSIFDSSGFYRFVGGTGEKIVGAPIVRFGRMFLTSHIPGSNLCSLGSSRLYALNVETCGGGLFDDTGDTHDVTSNLYVETPGLISEPVFANGQLYALNMDEDGLDQDDVIDDLNVTPDSFTEHVYVSFRHVF